MLAAISFPLGAAVTAAPGLEDVVDGTPDRPVAVSVPWLAMFAADEDDADAGRIADFRATTQVASSVFTSVVTYPQAAGPFYHHSRELVEHAAEFDSSQRTLEWLNLRVVPRLTPLAHAWRARHPAV